MCSTNGNWNILIILMVKLGFTMAITTYNMHHLCGANLDVRLKAGEIFFNTSDLPENLAENTCRLSLRAPSTSDTNYMILFYFTQFKFYDLCTDANMTFIDGSSLTDRTISGLPHTVCGINSTLEKDGLYFTSIGGYVRLIFKKNHTSFTNIFTINFISYHTGPCDTDSSYECSNGNCIPRDDVCSDGIDHCGKIYDTICMSGISTTPTPTPTPVKSTDASIVVAITVAIVVLIAISLSCSIPMFRDSYRRDGLTTRIQSTRQSTNEVTQQCHSEPTNHQSSPSFELSTISDSGAYGSCSYISDPPPVTPSASPPDYTSIIDAPPSYNDAISTEGRTQRNCMKS